MNRIKIWWGLFLSLFKRKKIDRVVISTPFIESAKIEIQREAYVPAMGRLRDITMQLDAEASEIWDKRSPYVK